MKYNALARAIALTLPVALLAGCTNNDSTDDTTTPAVIEGASIAFDPANGVLPMNTNLHGFDQGTLAIPSATDWREDSSASGEESPNAFWNYFSAMDGWGVSSPIVINLNLETNAAIDASTLTAESIQLFKSDSEGNLTAMVWNEQYRAITSSQGTLNIEPLRPFEAGTTYYLAVTNEVEAINSDSGEVLPLSPSSAYTQLLSDDSSAEGQRLQSIHSTLSSEADIDSNTIAYAADFTTTSTLDILRPVVTRFLENQGPNATITLDTPVDEATAQSAISKEQQFADTVNKAITAASEDAVAQDDSLPYELVTATIELPYYLDTAKLGTNCDFYLAAEGTAAEVRVGELPEGDNVNSFYAAPQKYCPGAFSYWQTQDAEGNPTGIPVTGETAGDLYAFEERKPLKLLLSIPKATARMPRPENGWKVFLYAHGYGSSKNEIATLAADMAKKGYAMISLDQPTHGDRTVDIDGDGTADIEALSRRTDYVMGNNLLTTKGYLHQAMMDYVGVRKAIANGVVDNEGLLLDSNNVHMAGLSLGGITTASVTALLRDSQLQNNDDDLALKTASMGVPGGGLASVIIQSPLLAEEVKGDFKRAAAYRLHMASRISSTNADVNIYDETADGNTFDKRVTALNTIDNSYIIPMTGHVNLQSACANGLAGACYAVNTYNTLTGTSPSAISFEQFDDLMWDDFLDSAERTAQSMIDAADPIGLASVLAKPEHQDMPLFLIEAAGDGSNNVNVFDIVKTLVGDGSQAWNPGDFVILNQASGMPLGGTDPLIRTLELDILTTSLKDSDVDGVVRGAARYGYGTHASMAIGLPFETVAATPDALVKGAVSTALNQMCTPTDGVDTYSFGLDDVLCHEEVKHLIVEKSPNVGNIIPLDQSVHTSIVQGIISMADNEGKAIKFKTKSGLLTGSKPLLLEDFDKFIPYELPVSDTTH